MNILSAINLRMHSNPCPTAGSLGECPAIWRVDVDGRMVDCSAAIYLWQAATDVRYADVATWFVDLGAVDVRVHAIMHDPDEVSEGRCSDGARPLEVYFALDAKLAAELGVISSEEALELEAAYA